jgi:putative transcriptional regulator
VIALRFGRNFLAATLGALLLAVGPTAGISAEEATHLTAVLVVARDELPDPYFADSVVLVLNNLGESPAGIIINHPTKIPVAELFPDIKQLAGLPNVIYFGGPVEVSSVWFLFRASKPPEKDAAIQAFAGVYLSGSRELLRKLLAREHPMEGLRIFVGHAGWGPGQLEAEIARGDWKLEHAEAAAIFGGKYDHKKPAAQAPKDGA